MGKLGPDTSNHKLRHMISNSKSRGFTWLTKSSQDWVRLGFWYFGHYDTLGKTGPKYPRSLAGKYKKYMFERVLVLVMTCVRGWFGINYPNAFLNFWNCPSKTKISKFLKITRVIYPKNHPNQTSGYWLITPNQQTLCIETNIF